MLTQGTSYSNLKERIMPLFVNFRKFNVKIKTSKFMQEKEVKFGRFISVSILILKWTQEWRRSSS